MTRQELKLKYVVVHVKHNGVKIERLFLAEKCGSWTKDLDEARLFDRASDGAVALVVMKTLNEIPEDVDIDFINIQICTYADRSLGRII